MKISQAITHGTLIALTTVSVAGAEYKLTDSFVGKAFNDAFDWLAISDPTHGRVNYVNQSTALRNNLTFASDDTFILRSDFKNVVPPSSSGRDSVRIESKKRFTYHTTVYDVRHMPQGCGTWPAIWETNTIYYGEIDVVEGVNSEPQNVATFWTDPSGGCRQTVKTDLIGEPTLKDCSEGCPVQQSSKKSFGTAFNQNGGGWYTLERLPTSVKIWFWERNDSSVPEDVKGGKDIVDPAKWGKPFFEVTNEHCDIDKQLKSHNIIINLTFCGEYAGSPQYERAGCPGTCQGTVDSTPGEYANAFFDIASIRVYQ